MQNHRVFRTERHFLFPTGELMNPLAKDIALAIFMRDSKPKDVVACTTAYAAVLVVFVDLGGGNT